MKSLILAASLVMVLLAVGCAGEVPDYIYFESVQLERPVNLSKLKS
jgi:hypothetical protein